MIFIYDTSHTVRTKNGMKGESHESCLPCTDLVMAAADDDSDNGKGDNNVDGDAINERTSSLYFKVILKE